MSKSERVQEWLKQMTPRQCDVAFTVGRGLSNQEAADELCLSKATVDDHLTTIYQKLDIHFAELYPHLTKRYLLVHIVSWMNGDTPH